MTRITTYRQDRPKEWLLEHPIETWRCDIFPEDGSDHHGVGAIESEAIINAALALQRWEKRNMNNQEAARTAADANRNITVIYTNWRGETAERTIRPLGLWFGSTKWHPENQWMMSAFDVEKGGRARLRPARHADEARRLIHTPSTKITGT